jgi:hypothetical protein
LIDIWGDHTSTCRLSGLTSPKHDALRDLNKAQLSRAYFGVESEPVGLVQGSDARPADVLVKRFGRPEDTWIDYTIVGPFSPTHLKGSSNEVGKATSTKESLKRSLAQEACEALGSVFIPFAVTTVGGLGGEARKSLCRIAASVANQCRTEFGCELGLLMREISVSIHSGNNRMWEQQDFALHPFMRGARKRARSGVARGMRAARARAV